MKPDRIKSPMTVFLSKSRVEKQPYGSVLIIGPFNYPFQLLVEPLVAALSAGNCAVLSPSELTPHTAEVIRNLIAGTFPPEYVFCAEGGVENNTVLLHSRFDKIFFTGSTNVGKIVMRAAAENLVPVTLELGGKSPVIIGESAKLDTACERIVWGKFMNAGQTCVAPDYVFVPKKIFKNFVEQLKETIVRFYGEDIRNNPDYGRIVNEQHFNRLESMLGEDKPVSHIINPNLPFGGVGYSGMGNYHGKYGFLDFTHLRSVLKRSTRFKLRVAFPPFSQKKLNALKKYMK